MTMASLLQVIAQEASRFKTRPQAGFTLAGLADGSHLYMAIRRSI